MTVASTPLDLVLTEYIFPPFIEWRDYQIERINAQAPLPRSGYYWDPGTGKTLGSTCSAIYKKLVRGNVTIVTMPPVLIKQWWKWLSSVTCKATGKPVAALMYRGTPKQRARLSFEGQDFILMSTQIFKKDYDRLVREFEGLPVSVIVDEATAIKNVASANYKMIRDFAGAAPDRELMLLTGSPLTTPADAYAYVKLVSPQVYRNQKHFEDIHVAERDFFNNVVRWGHLEFLADNLMLNSSRVLKNVALPYLKLPNYIPMVYELEDEHLKLYKKLANEQLLLLPDGGKIDATVRMKLYTCLQQIVCNPGHFSGDPTLRSAAHDLLDTVLDDIRAGKPGGKKLIVSALYRMTNRGLLDYLKPYNAVGAYGDISVPQQSRNKERFIEDPHCWVFVVQPGSAYGLDGFQQVCSEMLFLEEPIVPRDFIQVKDRIDRDGQTEAPNIRIAIAEGTIQHRLHANLLTKDELVNAVQGGFQDLRAAIHGES